MAATNVVACPCGSGMPYGQCCALLHDGAPAADAEALMRSRYSAYALRLAPYLVETWHPSTRPTLTTDDLDPQTTWLSLRIIGHRPATQGPDAAEVEFVAVSRIGGGSAQRLHERSRFRREAGRWYYVDGDIMEARRRR
ncbi:YchJ family protein [Solimonas marina]|uniref:UPF0225 protein G7Y82_08170 n=1 Tax=Solimonas marina TaxID=2714601 RepID=A0A969W7Y9_9GAMM|nr:YchJ family protein [Solimonas marina]NKF22292.1 YchJ family protein [Solimonas marina]